MKYGFILDFVQVEVNQLDVGIGGGAAVSLEAGFEATRAHRHGRELLGVETKKPNRAFHGRPDTTKKAGTGRRPPNRAE